MEIHPVYRTLNKPMTLLGVERRLFFFILVASFLLFHLTKAVVPAIFLFCVLAAFARGATQTDAQILRILVNSNRFGTRYDPALKERANLG